MIKFDLVQPACEACVVCLLTDFPIQSMCSDLAIYLILDMYACVDLVLWIIVKYCAWLILF